MIIVGYQGIGKSTCTETHSNVIDLESSNFFVDGKRDENWYKIYINIAEHLSNQGNVVFISSHKIVREELNKRNINFYVICPSLNLKDKWIAKLKERYDRESSDKNYKAWKNAENYYEDNIKDLLSEKQTITIDYMHYGLWELIEPELWNL